jgi:predicted nucleotidyltransferase
MGAVITLAQSLDESAFNMNKTDILFSSLFGSRLYGTQTPTSDLDRKLIYLPSLNDLLLNKNIKNSMSGPETQKVLRTPLKTQTSSISRCTSLLVTSWKVRHMLLS